VTRCGLLLTLACAAACAATSPIPQPTAADASRGSARFPDLTLNELSHGRTLYLSRCGSCHVLKRPAELSAEQWEHEVEEMREKNGVKLSDADARAITRYLAVAAGAGAG
jgi:mono/diheme cytochrome c family protein